MTHTPSPHGSSQDTDQPAAAGPFAPTWASLEQYQVPSWFRDAKFGIWAHWGPQCQPEQGDWYARFLYMQKAPPWGAGRYDFHCRAYGHPSRFGFKDVIDTWKAERWDPDALLSLYKRAGAKYFMALANHHDNFDTWNSKHQPWNSVRLGPRRDLIAGWAKAARAHGLRFGVSVHAAHAWTWYEPAQGADVTGPQQGVPYDGNHTAADGMGTWWDGMDPQDLYAQRHARSARWEDPTAAHEQWDWGNGASVPDAAYCRKFLNRTLDLIEQARPDLMYFDDTVLPLWPISDVGLMIAAHLYNRSVEWHDGRNEAVLFGKILNADQRKAIVWDVERGSPNQIEAAPWQTCTCIGQWHYQRSLYHEHTYRGAAQVIGTLADTVSKNGNLLLSVPVRGDGTIDGDEVAILESLSGWMDANGECIFGTRPWKVYGEGPSVAQARPLTAQGFNEGAKLTAEDARFTTRGKTVYAIVLGRPEGEVRIASFGTAAGLLDAPIAEIARLGDHGKLSWTQTAEAVSIRPQSGTPSMDETPVVFKITLR